MTRDELLEEMWDSLPWLRKRLLGRERVNRLVESCISQTPVELLSHVADRPEEVEVVEAAWRGDSKKRYSTRYGDDVIEFGPIFWIVAAAVIQYIVQRLLEWWFERRECRSLIEAWRAES